MRGMLVPTYLFRARPPVTNANSGDHLKNLCPGMQDRRTVDNESYILWYYCTVDSIRPKTYSVVARELFRLSS